MHGRVGIFIAATLLAGCSRASELPPPATIPDHGAHFRAEEAGSVTGRVIWEGKLPDAPPLPMPLPQRGVSGLNPHFPRVNAKSLVIDEALVYLRGVDLGKSQPWSHPPVEVGFVDKQLFVTQGDRRGRWGVVHRGREFRAISHEDKKHYLIGRGANSFSLPLLQTERATAHNLTHSGLVELSSGSGFFWLRGFLWVSDHPYATITTSDGTFRMNQIPPGDYELACLMPNWHIKRFERNAEDGEIERVVFHDAVEMTQPITITAQKAAEATFTWSLDRFRVKTSN